MEETGLERDYTVINPILLSIKWNTVFSIKFADQHLGFFNFLFLEISSWTLAFPLVTLKLINTIQDQLRFGYCHSCIQMQFQHTWDIWLLSQQWNELAEKVERFVYSCATCGSRNGLWISQDHSAAPETKGKGVEQDWGGHFNFCILRKVDRKTPVLPLLEIQQSAVTEWDLKGKQYSRWYFFFNKVIFGRNFLAVFQNFWNTMERAESWQSSGDTGPTRVEMQNRNQVFY